MTKEIKPEPLLTIDDSVHLKIIRKIAEGGMGAVYEAQQMGTEGFEKTVAIKIMLSKLVKKQFSDLFIAEAKLVANLVHENIVQIYQLGRTSAGYYIVMEYVNGVSLANFLSYHRTLNIPFPEELAVFIISRIARGLAYAHKREDAQGNFLAIVHRDVCPANIMITTEGLPKLADFGVAKAAKRALPGDGMFVGKILYMAPEQAQKKSVDYRADVFSLGAVLFELLSYQTIRKIDKKTTTTNAGKLAVKEIPWDFLPNSTTEELRAILRSMMALNPKDRYQDTDILAHDLEYYIYQKGYGPTIQTLERYLRTRFTYLYLKQNEKNGTSLTDSTTVAHFPK